MRRLIGILFCVSSLCACSSRYAALNEQGFQTIQTGTSIMVMERKYGRPVTIQERENDSIYEYVVQEYMGKQAVRQVRYCFVVQDGKIKGKYRTTSDLPLLELFKDAYPDQ